MTGTSSSAAAASDQGAGTSNWNLPNALTTMRILMVPFFGWSLLHLDGQSVTWRLVAFGLFVAAMVTDKIDGDIARARNLVTDFGKIADPIADKAITGMAFIGLSIVMDEWWMWVVTAIVLAREWTVTLLRLGVAKHVVMAASMSGKIKTVLQALALAGLTLPLLQVSGWLDQPGKVLYALSLALLAGAVAMTIWSGFEFFRDVWRQRHTMRADPSQTH